MTEREHIQHTATEGGDYAEHDIDKRAGQFGDMSQQVQQQVIFATYNEIEKMTTEQRIEATFRTVLLLQADFVAFESDVSKLLAVVQQIEKHQVRSNDALLVLCILVGLLFLYSVSVSLYWFLNRVPI